MKTCYETPEANVIAFSSKEQIAIVEEIGPQPEPSVGSKDF